MGVDGVMDYVVFGDFVQRATTTVILLKSLSYRKCVVYCHSDESARDLREYLAKQSIRSTMLTGKSRMFRSVNNEAELVNFLRHDSRLLITTDASAVEWGLFVNVDLVLNFTLADCCETQTLRRQQCFSLQSTSSVMITFLCNQEQQEKLYWYVWRTGVEVKVLDMDFNCPANLLQNRAYFLGQLPFMEHPNVLRTAEPRC